MSDVQRLLIEEDGEIYEVYVETKTPTNLIEPGEPTSGKRPGEKGVTEDTLVKMQEAQRMIRGYVVYALGAFKHSFGVAKVEEVTFKFGLKIGGKAGIPFVTEGTTEGNLEIEVKCKFPSNN